MTEYENVREALKALIEITDAEFISVDGKTVTVADLQEIIRERAYDIADLLGMEELYLDLKKRVGGRVKWNN